jgi:hypothetical protein
MEHPRYAELENCQEDQLEINCAVLMHSLGRHKRPTESDGIFAQ